MMKKYLKIGFRQNIRFLTFHKTLKAIFLKLLLCVINGELNSCIRTSSVKAAGLHSLAGCQVSEFIRNNTIIIVDMTIVKRPNKVGSMSCMTNFKKIVIFESSVFVPRFMIGLEHFQPNKHSVTVQV